MFRRLSEPLPLSEASLLLLRPAMNAPVLNIGFLPVGPARAAVVAFAEEYGGIGIALGIRSNETGKLVVIRNQESIDFDVRLSDALEPLLAEAERMGFLFDEDMLEARPGPRGRSEAMVHWAVLMGGMESLLPTLSQQEEPGAQAEAAEAAGALSPSLAVAESQYPELILDDVAPFELAADAPETPSADGTFEDDDGSPFRPDFGPDLETDFDGDLDASLEDVLDEALASGLGDDLQPDLETGPARGLAAEESDRDLADPLLSGLDLTEPTAPIAAPRPVRPSPAAVRPPVVLSKFRNAGVRPANAAAGGRNAEVGADRSAELARIPIVRVLREVEKKVPFLARLLSSF